MKGSVMGFRQSKLIENGLTTDDALILRVIKDMYSSSSMEFKDFDGIKYMWINYTYLFSQIPITGSKRNLMRRIEVYGTEHLLLRILERVRNGKKGSFSYISPTEKLDSLQDLDPYDKMSHPTLGQNVTPPMTERHTKDSSYIDSSNNIYTIFEFWNNTKVLVHRKMSDKLRGHINASLSNFSVEEICKAITNYSVVVKGEQYYWTHKWRLDEFLLRGLDKFLDENEPLKNFIDKAKAKTEIQPKSTEDKSREIIAKQMEAIRKRKESEKHDS